MWFCSVYIFGASIAINAHHTHHSDNKRHENQVADGTDRSRREHNLKIAAEQKEKTLKGI